MTSGRDTVYPSKVDTWIAVLLIAVGLMALVSLAVGAYALASGGADPGGAWGWMGSGLFLVALYALLVWPVNYTLTEDKLVIRFGVVRFRIPYATISEVKPTRSILSSPALSLDRLFIDHTGKTGFAMISPADKESFLTELAERAPHLKREGDRLRGQAREG